MIGGAVAAWLVWGAVGLTGDHATVAGLMVPILGFGLASGVIMVRRPAPRRVLPLLHGLNNLVAICLAGYQAYSGWRVLTDFVWL
jgi:hypothetical protein